MNQPSVRRITARETRAGTQRSLPRLVAAARQRPDYGDAMRTPDRMIAVAAWLLENGHRALLAVTGGRFPTTVAGMQPVELHTTGRRSGQRRSTLLTAPICEEDRKS